MTIHPILTLGTFLFATVISVAADLPDGPGKTETSRICSRCHTLEQATSLRQGQVAWTATISKMMNLGAQGNAEDFDRILSYLVKFYAPIGANTPSLTEKQPANTESEGGAIPTAALNKKEASLPADGHVVAAAKEWRTYGHDAGGMRFSPLDQITPENVNGLKIAWVYHMRPPDFKGPALPSAMLPPAGPVGDEPSQAAGGGGGGAARSAFAGTRVSVPAKTRPLSFTDSCTSPLLTRASWPSIRSTVRKYGRIPCPPGLFTPRT